MEDNMEPMKGIKLEQYEAGARARLVSMGFEMAKPYGLWATINGEYLIDFSAIDPDKYLIYAAKEIEHMAYRKGQESIKNKLRELVK